MKNFNEYYINDLSFSKILSEVEKIKSKSLVTKMKTIILFQNNDINRTPDTLKMLIEQLQSKITRNLSKIFDYI